MKKRKMYKQIQTFKRQGYSRNKIAIELEISPRTAALLSDSYFGMNVIICEKIVLPVFMYHLSIIRKIIYYFEE